MAKAMNDQSIPPGEGILHHAEGVDLIPANIELAGLEVSLVNCMNREKMLKQVLDSAKHDYDFILLDCPPSLSLLTLNALCACDTVLIPLQCEFYSLEGLSQLITTVKKIKSHYNDRLDVAGILITMYNPRLLLSMQVMHELKTYYKDKLFSTQISRNVKLSEAPGFGKPVYYHDKKSKGAQEYLDVAKELIRRV